MSDPDLKEKIITMPLFEPPNHHCTIWKTQTKTDKNLIATLLAKMIIEYHTKKIKNGNENE